jgi:hypothetical protein
MKSLEEGGAQNGMVEPWLEALMADYNHDSFEQRDQYKAQIHFRGSVLQEIVWWALQSLPDEILVGLDFDGSKPVLPEVQERYRSEFEQQDLFQGQGFVVTEAHIVNRGDSYSVHHLPEEWIDGLYAQDRGSRAGRFTHWLHTHPNAPALPSGADADAAQETTGVDLILGLRFTPEGPLPWYDDYEGVQRSLGVKEKQPRKRGFFARHRLPVLGIAPTGHSIHELQLIAFHKNGFGVNVVLVDDEGVPYSNDYDSND